MRAAPTRPTSACRTVLFPRKSTPPKRKPPARLKPCAGAKPAKPASDRANGFSHRVNATERHSPGLLSGAAADGKSGSDRPDRRLASAVERLNKALVSPGVRFGWFAPIHGAAVD